LPQPWKLVTQANATCYASYENGIIDSQIIGLARRVAGAAVYGARKLDEPVLH
jgi:hypothetical protein